MTTPDFRIPGFLFSGISAGIKKDGRRDLGLIYSESPAHAAGLFTTNAVKAAPVLLDQERIKGGRCQAIVINSGNANACTGKQGLQDAQQVSSRLSRHLKIDDGLVLISSTGVIGVRLPTQKIKARIPKLVDDLSPDGWMHTVEAIMTTDSFPKAETATCRIGGKRVKLCGMAKGAGMICPRVATMLSFLVTDANIKGPVLKRMLSQVAENSYNRITVDGDMSTNDTVLLLANGKADHLVIDHMDRKGRIFGGMLSEVCQALAKGVVKDGEGATKFIEIIVKGARDAQDARKAAYAIAHSPLVKTAFFGEDANWGRILCALGHSGVQVEPDRIDLFFDHFQVVKRGVGVGSRLEERAAQGLKKKAFKVIIDLHQGKGCCTVFTCDLSLDYVKINASYRS